MVPNGGGGVGGVMMLQVHLQRALEEVGRRQEVQDCLTDIITNVEWAAHCNQALQHQSTYDALERVQDQQAAVWAETALIQRQDEQGRTALADSLVRELYQVSQKLGELYQLKQDHLELSQNYDALVAQLLQAEERIQFMKEGGRSSDEENDEQQNTISTVAQEGQTLPATKPSTVTTAVVGSGATLASTGTSTTIPTAVLNPPPTTQGATPAATVVAMPPLAAASSLAVSVQQPPVSLDITNPPTLTTTQQTQPSHPVVSIDTKAEASSVLQPAETAPSTKPVVVLIEEDEPPSLDTMETPVLMHIFAYLDALDILNTAQINISMYSRVDNLFGLADGGGAEGDNSTIATVESAPTQTPAPAPAPTKPASAPAPTKPAATLAQHPPHATMVSLPPPPAPVTSAAAAPAPTVAHAPPLPLTPKQGQAASAMATGGSGPLPPSIQGFEKTLFGFLQPRKSPVIPPTAPSVVTNTTATNTTATNTPTMPSRKSPRPSEPAPMNAAMANSMASKLTDAELNAIIQMTERLRSKEQQLEQLREERERLLAQLDGVDAVKQFLVAKVRSMEESLRKTEDQEAKVAQQIAGDQEVIAFLDGRVQELEEALASSQEETRKLKQENVAYQTQAEQKATVLTDMLRFERERVQETLTEYKTTKKLLVKEVKSCRAQIMALTAQNKAVLQENETLKRALLLNSSHPSSPPASKYPQARTAGASAISS